MIKLSSFAFFLLFGIHIVAQNIILSDIPNQGQLPSGQVNCLFQDSEGYIWYGTEEGLCRDDGYEIRVFRSDFHSLELIKSNSVTCITEDKKGRIWFGTKRGVYVLDKKEYQISPLSDNEIEGWSIITMISTSDSTIWVSTNNMLLRYNIEEGKIGTYHSKWEGAPKRIHYFYEDEETNNLWVVQWRGGILRYDPITDQFIPYSWPFREFPTSIIKDRYRPYYWVTTWGKGVVRFDPLSEDPDKMFVHQSSTFSVENPLQGEILNIQQDCTQNYLWVISTDNLYVYSISGNDMLSPVNTTSFLSDEKKILTSILSDNLGNVWVAGQHPHSFITSFLKGKIERNLVSTLKKKLGYPANISMLIYDDTCFWLWPKRGGLCLYNPQNEHIEFSRLGNFKLSPFLERSYVNKGIYCVLNDKQILHLQHKENKIHESEVVNISPYCDPEDWIRTLHEDKLGRLWIGTSRDLFQYDLKTKKLERKWRNAGLINDVISSHDNSIYIATEKNGILRLSGEEKMEIGNTKENCTNMAIAPDNKVWIGTQQGNVYCYNPPTHDLVSMAEECKLDGSTIHKIEISLAGNIWIMTNQRITVFNPYRNELNTIHTSDPAILMSSFNSLCKDSESNFYVAGTEGFFVYPSQLSQEKDMEIPQESTLKLTGLKVNGNSRMLNYENEIIKLKPNERDIELFLSTFDILNKANIHFASRYKNGNSHWNYLSQGQNNIYLTQLPKGYNEIEVKATDKNGNWRDNNMIIRIYLSPEWYETWLAYCIYIVILLVIIAYLIRTYVKRQEDKSRIQMEEQIAQMKFRFFTNISHELRTPLTLIMTPLDTLIKKISDIETRKQLEIMHKNTRNLLDTVNQLLDFRKIEMGGETLSLSRGEMKGLLEEIHENFQPMATQKEITFGFCCDLKCVYVNMDYKKVRKIVNNLLSNAFKFTKKTGKVVFTLEVETIDTREYAVIKVEDSGIGIPENELMNIFERFHQVSTRNEHTGSGIGLHLVKEYVEMHQGYITVNSTVNKGTIFSVYIPIDISVSNELDMETAEVSLQKRELDHTRDKKILIVEDNTEFRTYLKNELSNYFIVYEAADGEEGEKEVLEKDPDVVITDLMMPKMNGFELCSRIKNNIRISHIPVILLTASSNIENEKTGYKEGADAYISKPFNWDVLLARIQNLIKQGMQRQQSFMKDIEATPQSITISTIDEKLMEKAIKLVEENITNTEYSIECLSHDMAMSRVHLFRKIRSITGMSPSDFVKSIRLKRAAKLLATGESNVVEVVYSVGFNTPSYFAKSFKKMFGVLPSEYSKSLKNEDGT